MNHTLCIAWRNLWRNPRRTLITVVAIGLNVAVLIASYGLMEGILEHFLSSATNIVVGEVQIHSPKFLVDRSMYRDLEAPDDILSRLKRWNLPAVARSYGFGLVAHGTKSAGTLFWGVDPVAERSVFDLAGNVLEGSFLSPVPQGGIVLGKKLARTLNVSVGDEIIVVVQAADGSLGNELYHVRGILKNVGDRIDREAAILHREDFKTLFVSGGRIHEIAVNTRGKVPLERLKEMAARAAPGAEIKTWRDLLPSLSDMMNFFDASMWLMGMIFFIAAALGVMNTMLMSTFERIREFGILKALGATPWRILLDVAAEAWVLGLISTLAGILIGLPLTYYLQVAGLDLSMFASGDVSVAGVALDPIWRAALAPKTVAVPVVVMWVVCLLASLYPAAIAARLDPVKAMVRT
ncbi:MAG: ABC transporter permease [Deltaproteobacteria bacterium]|nr:ABC transporter permease [Deltaproteobacteria bacterium]